MKDLHALSAVGAHSRHLHRMRADRKSVAAGALVEPGVEVTLRELDHSMAPLADEMVMMPFAAEAVARLARVVVERVHRAALAERSQRPVDGGETDTVAASS
jgi:hypothetical protein